MPLHPPRPAAEHRHRTRQNRIARKPAPKVFRHLPGRSITPRRRLLHRLQADRLKIPRNRRIQHPRRNRRHVPDLIQQRRHVAPGKWRSPTQCIIKQRPKPIDIRLRHRLPLPSLLRRKPRRRPHTLICQGQLSVNHAARALHQPEIRHARLVVRINQNVRRLQVPVQQPVVVRMLNRRRNLRHQCRRLPWSQRSPALHPLTQRRPGNQFHAEKRMAVRLAHIKNLHHMRMIQPRRRPRLHPKPPQRIRIRQRSTRNHLQRHIALQTPLPRTVHHTHPPAPQFLQQFIITQTIRPRPRNPRIPRLRHLTARHHIIPLVPVVPNPERRRPKAPRTQPRHAGMNRRATLSAHGR